MIDRKIDKEKVIKGLTAIQDEAYDRWVHRQYIKDQLITLIKDNIPDALTLLKEQEAIKPVPPENEFGLYRCGKCYHQLFRCVDKYCSRCGKAVKWE